MVRGRSIEGFVCQDQDYEGNPGPDRQPGQIWLLGYTYPGGRVVHQGHNVQQFLSSGMSCRQTGLKEIIL